PATVADTLRAARAGDWIARGRTALQADASATAYESLRRAAAIDSRSAEALRGVTDASGPARRVDETRSWLETLTGQDPSNAPAWIELAHVRAATGDTAGAVDAAIAAVRTDPSSPLALEQLASVFEDASDGERLTAVADELTMRFADRESG